MTKALIQAITAAANVNHTYPYIGVCSDFGAYAVFYSKGVGVLLSAGNSWLKVGCKVSENGFQIEDQITTKEQINCAKGILGCNRINCSGVYHE